MPIYNFSAGPAMLPPEVITQIQAELPSLANSGMSILEISHRTKLFENILNTAKADLRALLNISSDYEILFMQGGGTAQFAAVPLNLVTHSKKIAFIDSGYWSMRAIQEAQTLGFTTAILASSQKQNYTNIPKLDISTPLDDYAYLHLTTNSTIEGLSIHAIPNNLKIPLVADMSSNFLAEPYNINDFDLVYAGAQKNLGPAGVSVVIIKKRLLVSYSNITSVMNYHLTAQKNSMFNTPPVFAIYTVGLVLKWLKAQGGVAAIYEKNLKKAQLLYQFIDNSKFYTNNINKKDRSLTNITFTTGSSSLDEKVIQAATAAGCLNLKGHRSFGGLRASLYNAMPLEGVLALIDFLTTFEENNR
ncbi:3-phosphoserine/phosphohydroxythreonine transaminase [Periweissella beninensis]|uniref:Phosphoserine aminotransferase n=1 Tax=Periweissella beninensis TaxID=504936 RepID=A0ABT0VHV2_9LACO|nr:3-phosphoserine/phosphohydroxythreonine transaminase [Periweissella beninensis]MBM7544028.1 phosphoserine aminotransferase [Periweissella beninensis]MCM2437414.1 3-phosphoserine/phosphohydroxythreonine transaminase [Periweissella beninensis]MCT4396537.1 3-phosphoserine/phosphohydroxythreonine transaminase [Periweissella beninensis]